VGEVQLGKLRPVDIDHMYSRWRQDGMAESSVRRLHNLLHSALGQASASRTRPGHRQADEHEPDRLVVRHWRPGPADPGSHRSRDGRAIVGPNLPGPHGQSSQRTKSRVRHS
jgi:hypothetical protein